VFNPDKEQGEDEAVRVQVTRVVENNVGRHFFVTADGQEWRQTVVGKVREPKDLPAAATIVRESYGSPQLSFDSRPGKKYRVRRVK